MPLADEFSRWYCVRPTGCFTLALRRRGIGEDMVEPDRIDALYGTVFDEVAAIVDASRNFAARSVNATLTAAYWMIGRSIVEFEQAGEERAEYGAKLLERLSSDLTRRYGRGFSARNIADMRLFYISYQPDRILQTVSAKSQYLRLV